MNLFESIKSGLKESDFALDFEKNIPHHMRFKTWDIINDPDRPKRYLYWVTQEPFDDLDIERFRDAFVNTGFSDAYVTVRDLSSHDFNSDKDAGVLVHISKDGTIDADDYLAKANDRGWFNESEELTEASGFGSIYLAEIGYNGVVGTCRGIGKTPEEAKANVVKFFKQTYPQELDWLMNDKPEYKDKPEMEAIEDWWGISTFDMSSGASNEGGGSLKED